jgi:hypothetical protein
MSPMSAGGRFDFSLFFILSLLSILSKKTDIPLSPPPLQPPYFFLRVFVPSCEIGGATLALRRTGNASVLGVKKIVEGA